MPSSRAGCRSWGTIIISQEQMERNEFKGTNGTERMEWNE